MNKKNEVENNENFSKLNFFKEEESKIILKKNLYFKVKFNDSYMFIPKNFFLKRFIDKLNSFEQLFFNDLFKIIKKDNSDVSDTRINRELQVHFALQKEVDELKKKFPQKKITPFFLSKHSKFGIRTIKKHFKNLDI